jgi:nucleoside-triphosphatase THEP1
MAKTINLTGQNGVYKGTAVILTCQELQADGVTPRDITGWTIRMTTKKRVTDPDSAAIASLTKDATISNAAQGQYTFVFTTTDTFVNATTYAVDIQRTDDGSETVLAIGKLDIVQEVRKR